MSRFNYENQINLNLIFPVWYHQKSINDTIALLKSYIIWYNIWYNICISCSVYCFMFSRSLCNLMILNFEIFQNGFLYMWYVLRFRSISCITKHTKNLWKSVIFSNFAHWRIATCPAHRWLISRFCNETIHTESESTPHFMILNTHKSFIDIFYIRY